jgi:hypothetical protein
MTMKFTHPCTGCVPLGTFEDPDEGYLEFYWCPTRLGPSFGSSFDSVIARFGEECHEYISYNPPEAFADPTHLLSRHPWYGEILERAKKRGLYIPPK